jgi:hypothetical protein
MSSASFAAFSALAGVLLQQMISLLVEMTRRKHSEQEQVRRERLELYGAVIGQVRRVQRLSKVGPTRAGSDRDYEVALEQLGELVAQVRLLGSKELAQRLMAFEEVMRGDIRGDDSTKISPLIDLMRTDLSR